MKLADFKWMTKQQHKRLVTEAGGQIVLDFGKYHLSIIDDGYGSEYTIQNGVELTKDDRS